MNSRDRLEKAIADLTERARTNPDDPTLRDDFAENVVTFGDNLILSLELNVLKKLISEGKTLASVLLILPQGRIRDKMLNNFVEDQPYLQSITKSAVDAVDLIVLAPHSQRLQLLVNMIGNRDPEQVIKNNKELSYFYDNLAHEDKTKFLEYFSSNVKDLDNYQITFPSNPESPKGHPPLSPRSHRMFTAKADEASQPTSPKSPINDTKKRHGH